MEKHYSLTETAGLIRKALKESFPDTKFSITTKRYTGGSNITISFTNGPLTKDVQAVCSAFEGAGFDGSTDSTYYNKARSFRGELVTFNRGYVFVTREITERVLQMAAYRVHKETKLPLLTLTGDWKLLNGEYQVPFGYLKDTDVIAHANPKSTPSSEWYSQLVHQVSWNMATPHMRGQTDLPIIIDPLLDTLKSDSTIAPN
jgi:hypothetical protein